jgi:hypothetical protein
MDCNDGYSTQIAWFFSRENMTINQWISGISWVRKPKYSVQHLYVLSIYLVEQKPWFPVDGL